MNTLVTKDATYKLQQWSPTLESPRQLLIASMNGKASMLAAETLANTLTNNDNISLFVAPMPEDQTVETSGLVEWLATWEKSQTIVPLLYIPNALLVLNDETLHKVVKNSHHYNLSILASMSEDGLGDNLGNSIEGLFNEVVRV